jgi:hypothetical protein
MCFVRDELKIWELTYQVEGKRRRKLDDGGK